MKHILILAVYSHKLIIIRIMIQQSCWHHYEVVDCEWNCTGGGNHLIT